ncbi:MAG: hypothetical protein IJ659_01355 [Alloprevotella sp.]|nr:hypothetical protein [Alloprevotella sp.]
MKKEHAATAGTLVGKIPSLAVTRYIRNGAVVTRKSHSEGRRSNTRGQFIQRQRMRHSIALWKDLSPVNPMFTQGKTAYLNFLSLANRLPVVYMPRNKAAIEGSLLMPGIPVSDGSLQPIRLHFGEVGGIPALVTDHRTDVVRPNEVFLLYTAEQQFLCEECPSVHFTVREVRREEFAVVDGCLALVSDDFACDMKGWALVRMMGRNCSPQGIVTRCKYYERYTTDEALEAAAKSYGGLK